MNHQCLIKQLLAVLCVLSHDNTANSFLQSPRKKFYTAAHSLFCLEKVEAALDKLVWEKLEDRQDRPVLNLSERDSSTEDSALSKEDTSAWDKGQRWHETEQQLIELLNCSDVGFLLDASPQLYRLETAQIVETATWLSEEFGAKYVLEEPKFLTYRCSDVQYGLEFISMMMMLKSAKAACQTAPALLLSGVDGGIQERSVKKALGEASDATYNANQRIAGDAVATLKSIKNQSKK